MLIDANRNKLPLKAIAELICAKAYFVKTVDIFFRV